MITWRPIVVELPMYSGPFPTSVPSPNVALGKRRATANGLLSHEDAAFNDDLLDDRATRRWVERSHDASGPRAGAHTTSHS